MVEGPPQTHRIERLLDGGLPARAVPSPLISSGTVSDCPIDRRGLSEENGDWKTYWMPTRSSFVRFLVDFASSTPRAARPPNSRR